MARDIPMTFSTRGEEQQHRAQSDSHASAWRSGSVGQWPTAYMRAEMSQDDYARLISVIPAESASV